MKQQSTFWQHKNQQSTSQMTKKQNWKQKQQQATFQQQQQQTTINLPTTTRWATQRKQQPCQTEWPKRGKTTFFVSKNDCKWKKQQSALATRKNKKQQSMTYCFLATSIDVDATMTWQSDLHPCKPQLRKRKTAKTLLVNIWKKQPTSGQRRNGKGMGKTSQHLQTTRDKKVAKTETNCIWATSQRLRCPGWKQKTKTKPKTTTNLFDCSSLSEKENNNKKTTQASRIFEWHGAHVMCFFSTVFTVQVPGTVRCKLGPTTLLH